MNFRVRCRILTRPSGEAGHSSIVLKVNSVRVFLNPHSGKGGEHPRQLEALFAAHGLKSIFTVLTRKVKIADFAAKDDPEVAFIAAGGDGTVNCVASALAGSERTMGVLALGTLNHFARDLNLPLALEDAIAVIAAGQTRLVDAGEVNGHVFVNNSSLGAYPRMVLQREHLKQNGRNKWASLVVASLRAFVRFRSIQVEMQIGAEKTICPTPFLFIGNNQYSLDGLNAGTRKTLDQGRLALYLAPGANRKDILRMAVEALLGRIRKDPVYEELSAEAFSASTRGRRHLHVALDGEVMRLRCPLRYRSRPGALRVLCPAGSEPS